MNNAPPNNRRSVVFLSIHALRVDRFAVGRKHGLLIGVRYRLAAEERLSALLAQAT